MNCEDVRALLGSFIDDELSVELVARMNEHIGNCLECQDERTSLMTLRSRLHDLKPELDPPSGFVERLKKGVESRQRENKNILIFRKSSYIAPLAAAAAVLIFCLLPHQLEQRAPIATTSKIATTVKTDLTAKTVRIATAAKTVPLSAQQLYSYEHDIKKSKVLPVEYDSALAAKFTGSAAQPLHFQGWSLVKTCVVAVNSTKAIKYSYSQKDHGKIKTMDCYQFPGGVFDASRLAHHVINGRSICCGTQDDVSLVYWKKTDKDFVLASELPRADLMSIVLDS
jgi:Putative zinc-finger